MDNNKFKLFFIAQSPELFNQLNTGFNSFGVCIKILPICSSLTDGVPTFLRKTISNPSVLFFAFMCVFFFFFSSLTHPTASSRVVVILDLHSGPTAVYCIFSLFGCLLNVSYVCDYIDLMVSKSSNHPRSLGIRWISGFLPHSPAFSYSLSTVVYCMCMLRIYVVFLCVFFHCLIFFSSLFSHTWEMLSLSHSQEGDTKPWFIAFLFRKMVSFRGNRNVAHLCA